MQVTPGRAAEALAQTWQHLITHLGRGWCRTESGALAAVSGVALPTLNGVWAFGEEVKPEAVELLLAEVADTGLPHCLQSRPRHVRDLAESVETRSMVLEESVPLMVLERPVELESRARPVSLSLRQLGPLEAALHAEVAAAGFEAPREAFDQLMTPETLSAPGVRCYLGEVGGEAVTTGLGVTVGSFVGIFNIATPPVHRRNGYAEAVTTRAVLDGLAAGAGWAWLQSSPFGYRIYERLGFRTCEEWPCWVSAGN